MSMGINNESSYYTHELMQKNNQLLERQNRILEAQLETLAVANDIALIDVLGKTGRIREAEAHLRVLMGDDN